MILVYHPEGNEEVTRWVYNPRKLMSPEREAIERITGFDFAEFTQKVVKGNSKARRALLWIMLKREHPTLKYEDVDFAWDELRLEHSRQELELMREELEKNDALTAAELAAAQIYFEKELSTAYVEQEGKVLPPIVE